MYVNRGKDNITTRKRYILASLMGSVVRLQILKRGMLVQKQKIFPILMQRAGKSNSVLRIVLPSAVIYNC